MSLWWAQRDQLDEKQIDLIENLPLQKSHLIIGPPGSGKTNILLRRAQFVRSQDMPNVQVLTFTRALTEFVKTGCFDAGGREIFPPSLISTVESWIRSLYEQHEQELPNASLPEYRHLPTWKRALAIGATEFVARGHLPKFDTLFVDEVQDLLEEEVLLLREWCHTIFVVGDDKQRIYGADSGLKFITKVIEADNVHTLEFHYRVAPEISRMADRILNSTGTNSLTSTGLYNGPKPGSVEKHGPLAPDTQMEECINTIRRQLRVYADLIAAGGRLAIVVALRKDRDRVFDFLESQSDLSGKSKIIRARSGEEDDDYDPEFGNEPIVILTVQGCKGLEFRAVHWLFSETISHHHRSEHYYTVVTRAKTAIDFYYQTALPNELARAYAPKGGSIW